MTTCDPYGACVVTAELPPACSVYESPYVLASDPPEVADALKALSALGCHGDDMTRAGTVLRARPSHGEWLVVADGKAYRWFHACLEGPREFTGARVVWVAAAVVDG